MTDKQNKKAEVLDDPNDHLSGEEINYTLHHCYMDILDVKTDVESRHNQTADMQKFCNYLQKALNALSMPILCTTGTGITEGIYNGKENH